MESHYILERRKDGSAMLRGTDYRTLPSQGVLAGQWALIDQAVYEQLWQQRERVRKQIKEGKNTYCTLADVPILRWKREVTLTATEGKEVLVLIWGIELATAAQIPHAIINWRGLAPEERWWLCTQTMATRNMPGQIWTSRIGWRKALYHILCENPTSLGAIEAIPEPVLDEPRGK